MVSIRVYLLFVFVFGILVDMFNGYCQLFLHIEPIFPLVYKGGIILYSLPYVIKQQKVLMCFLIFALLLSVDMVSWIYHGHLEGFTALFDELIRFLYPFFILSVVWYYRKMIDKDFLLHYAMYYGLLVSTSVCITSFLGIGANSYGDDFGYGTKGFFTAGNDLSLSILLSFCICMYYLMVRGSFRYIIYSFPFIIVSMLIGSTAVMIGTIFIIAIFIVLPVFYRYNYPKAYTRYRYLLLCLGFPMMLYVMYRITQTDSYTKNKYNVEKLMAGSARKGLTDAYYSFASSFDTEDMLFGVGPEKLYYGVGCNFYGVLKKKQIEVDHLTLWGCYGYLLGTIILLYPLPPLVLFLKRRSLFSLWMSIAIILFIFHGIIAGHAYGSTTASLPMILILVTSFYQRAECYYHK